MCILIAKPAGAPLPSAETFARCFANNPHGCGYAVPGKAPKRFMALAPFLKSIAAEDPAQPMVIHFRYATHGRPCRSNCHPFYDGRAKVAFAHNGIMWRAPLLPGRTDSESAFREIFMPAIRKGGIGGQELARAAEAAREGGRLAFMDRHGRLRLFGDFIEDGGVFYSNSGYLPAYGQPPKGSRRHAFRTADAFAV